MSIFEALLRAAAALPSPEERYETYRPSFERNGLRAMIDPEGDGFLHLESGHTVLPTMHSENPDWTLHIHHGSDPMLTRKVTVHLGPGDNDVGDRIVKSLRRPDVMASMRDQMTGSGTWPRDFGPF